MDFLKLKYINCSRCFGDGRIKIKKLLKLRDVKVKCITCGGSGKVLKIPKNVKFIVNNDLKNISKKTN